MLTTALFAIALLSGQNNAPQADAQEPATQLPGVEVTGQTPEATTEAPPERTCRYVRQIGSSLQRRVCSDSPRQPRSSNMHSSWEAQRTLQRMQGSRLPDGS